jgi:hypothetical protein
MIAEVEKPNGTYEERDMGEPKCGTFCDHCGDCIGCSQHDDFCYDGDLPRWVIYLDDPLNPYAASVQQPSGQAGPSTGQIP